MGFLSTIWPPLVGVIAIGYALYLVHHNVNIGLGQSIIAVAGMVLICLPSIDVKLGTDGKIEISMIRDVNVATQQALQGIAALQSRLDNLAKATEDRLAALEKKTETPTSQTSPGGLLPTVANPPDANVPAITDWKIITKQLQDSLTGSDNEALRTLQFNRMVPE
ncbi:hypothetical protein AB9F36_31900 [Rhizobium leguminosarum]|uniref:hypothetical protein n=1 Tax=Rhizobium leguminosarum TaxID=384 RepID=UPI003F9CEB57